MWQRVGPLFWARVQSGPGGGLPIAAIFTQFFLAGLFCALVRDFLPPFAYGVFALSLTAAFLAIPLLGELGWLLRADEAAEWVEALPVTPRDLKIARTLHLGLLLGALALGSLVPAALFAPPETDLVSRLSFPVLGLGFAALIAALLLAVQSLLSGRAETLLIGFQTVLVMGVVVGLVSGMRHVPELARMPTIGDEHAPFLWFFPPAWFAAPLATAEGEPARLWLPLVATLGAVLLLVSIPAPRSRPPRGELWMAFLLRPIRSLATRLWLRKDERAPFDLVYDALPREREVGLRTYPMIGIPVAFLAVAVFGPEDSGNLGRDDLLALLFFTAGIYLPILLTHVPASDSAEARWLHETSPVEPSAMVGGTIKALAIRYLIPLYAALAFIGVLTGEARLTLMLAPSGALASLFILRSLYPVCVADLPLSVRPKEVRTDLDWISILGGAAIGLTLIAFLSRRFLTTPTSALLAFVFLVVVELAAEKRLRKSAPQAA